MEMQISISKSCINAIIPRNTKETSHRLIVFNIAIVYNKRIVYNLFLLHHAYTHSHTTHI